MIDIRAIIRVATRYSMWYFDNIYAKNACISGLKSALRPHF